MHRALRRNTATPSSLNSIFCWLLYVPKGLITQLLIKLGCNEQKVEADAESAVERLPRVSGGETYTAQDAMSALESA